jgi:hypothetical protein
MNEMIEHEKTIAQDEHAATYHVCRQCEKSERISLSRSGFWIPSGCGNWGYKNGDNECKYGPQTSCPYYLEHQLVKKKYVIASESAFLALTEGYHIELPVIPTYGIHLVRCKDGETRFVGYRTGMNELVLSEHTAWEWYKSVKGVKKSMRRRKNE